jgi:hypothetical protein
MKKFTLFCAVVIAAMALQSCSVSMPVLVTDNPVGSKVGEASYKVIFGFPPMNADAGIATDAKNGGISKVATVDIKVRGGLFTQTVSTVVTGE